MAEETRIAVITGASQGLGLGTAEALLAKGLHVILTARTEPEVAAGLAALGGSSSHLEGQVLDVADETSTERFFAWLLGRHGRLDVLINNAAYNYFDRSGPTPTFADTPPATVLDAFANNTLSAYRMTQRALPEMNRRGYGRIVNVSSNMGALGTMNDQEVAYRISKTAMNAVTAIAAHAAKGNVKINSVAPGWARTAMGGPDAPRSVEEAITGIVWAATLADDGPNGGFFRDGEPIAW